MQTISLIIPILNYAKYNRSLADTDKLTEIGQSVYFVQSCALIACVFLQLPASGQLSAV